MSSTCREALQELPSKLKTTLKTQIAEHITYINEARSKGYNYREIRKVLCGQGITIETSTLKKYVQQLNRTAITQYPNVLPLPKPR
ncbi:MAG: hypothetical protein F6J97_24515 [Leptolyngbya sp. SIO4C1]|nr:hypothetical protein [Leptolyngbya sp. SIO4C1]